MAVQTVQLTARPRREIGSRANKRLREAGLIPGVIYGHKKEVIPVALPGGELSQHLSHGAHVFDLDVEGKSEKVLLKDVQYDHLGSTVIHVDFNRVSLEELVRVTVPIELKGTPKGEADGGVLQQVMATLEVECRVLEIPEAIRHSVAEMALDEVLHIKDLKLPTGVKAVHDGELIVAMVKEVLEVLPVAPVVEEAAAEPEVIGRKVEEEGEAAAAPTEAAAPVKKEKEREKEK
jgi:large subunit ribosomal protein L25